MEKGGGERGVLFQLEGTTSAKIQKRKHQKFEWNLDVPMTFINT